ncbi:hypothetical protein AAG570_005561 [Ranatra chinensis]|uniref:Vacuolar protein sorting-associated protein 18 homolog n=1 Tax=Ranatra chinensis TaxID=642074 RepID=A0ABD0XXS6_9HEMI
MFVKQRSTFKPRYTEIITHMAISNDYLVIAKSNNVLMRIDLKKSGSVEPQAEIELNRIVPGVQLTGLFLDSTGNHLLISFSTELLYQHRKFPKPKPTSKLRGHEITAVGWHYISHTQSDSCTRPTLLGTSKGIIFEVDINADESIFMSSLEVYCKQLFDIGKGTDRAITGLQYHKQADADIYFVIVTTVNRLYKFVGKNSGPDERPLLQQLFNKYLNVPEGFQEIHSSLKYSCLQLYSNAPTSVPSYLGWLTETGIFCGEIDPSKMDNILSKTKMLSFPDTGSPPLSFVITDFHILLLYRDSVAVICSLSEAPVFKDDYDTEMNGKLVKITKDPVKGTIWVAAERALFRYKICDEDRNVWKIYSEKGDYELAKKFCKTPADKDQVLVKQAEALFNNKQYEESALHYAHTQSSVEEIALKFLEVQQDQALKTFLMKKLEKLRVMDKAHLTMLVIWILELILSQMGKLRIGGKQNTEIYESLQLDLDLFLKKPEVEKCILSNKNAIYDLIASHGDNKNLLKLAKAHKAYKKVINHYIYKGEYIKALDVLKEQDNDELWYDYAPTLVQGIPKITLSTIIMQKCLKPLRLLPALVAADTDQHSELIRYLEYCITDLNCQEQAVHNFLLSLYAQHRPDRLLSYLAMQGEEATMVNYDIGYAMRICQKYEHNEACVRLSALLDLWESAVDLALKVSVQVAKQTASQCPPHLSRKLWLKIAQHVVQEKNDISEAMQFLEECKLIKIEDILPFFPDFVTIDHFKDAICSSLHEYNQRILDLKEEMDDATRSAENIQNDISSFRSRYTVIEAEHVCVTCDLQLLLRPFYVFPCGHKFHTDCLIAELTSLIPEEEKRVIENLQVHRWLIAEQIVYQYSNSGRIFCYMYISKK